MVLFKEPDSRLIPRKRIEYRSDEALISSNGGFAG
jgi:hypothetical protein